MAMPILQSRMQLSLLRAYDLLVGMGHQPMPSIDAGLTPGLHRFKSFTDEILNKTISLRGPYDIFSGNRDDRIQIGSSRQPAGLLSYTTDKQHLAPGDVVI